MDYVTSVYNDELKENVTGEISLHAGGRNAQAHNVFYQIDAKSFPNRETLR